MTPLEQAAHTLHETNLQLSRVLHELAGAASLCWVPGPEGVLDTQAALAQVERAIAELRTPIRAALASLEAAKQEPLTNAKCDELAALFRKTCRDNDGFYPGTIIKGERAAIRAVIAAAFG